MSGWSKWENKVFEEALVSYDKENPGEWWQNVAAMVGKSVEEVKRHYERLVEDINRIEDGKVPLPDYDSHTTPKTGD